MARRRKSFDDVTNQLFRIEKLRKTLAQRNAMRAGNAQKSVDDYVERSKQLVNRSNAAIDIASKYRNNIRKKTQSYDEKVSYSSRVGIKG